MLVKMFHRLEETLIGLLLVAVTLLVFVEVVLRFGFNSGLHWAQEVTLLLNAWFVLLGASWALREKAHICVNALVRILPHHIRKITTSVAIVACLGYVWLFLQGSWVYLSKMKMIGIELEDLPIPKWTVMTVLIIGFGMLGIRLLMMLWSVWRYDEVEQFHHTELPDLDTDSIAQQLNDFELEDKKSGEKK